MKKETEKSKAHSRKWETELSAKLRVLRDEKKKWEAEREELKTNLETATNNVTNLRQLVVTSERNELSAKQMVKSVEGSLDELERLRIEVASLTERVRGYEAAEFQRRQAKESEERALARVKLLEMELAARDAELEKSQRVFDEEIHESLANGHEEEEQASRNQLLSQKILDDAVSASRQRIIEVQKAHHHLLKRYTALQSAYLDLKEHAEQLSEGKEALLPGGGLSNNYRERSPSSEPKLRSRKSQPELSKDVGMTQPVIPVSSTSYFRSPPSNMKLDTSRSEGNGEKSPTSGGHHFNYLHTFMSNPGPGSGVQGGAMSGVDGHGVGKKIASGSEMRVYGRGKYPFYLFG